MKDGKCDTFQCRSEEQYLEFLTTAESLTSFSETNLEIQNMANMLNITYTAEEQYWNNCYNPMPEITQWSEWAFAKNDPLNSVVLYHDKHTHFEAIVSRSDAFPSHNLNDHDEPVSQPDNLHARTHTNDAALPSTSPPASPLDSSPPPTKQPRTKVTRDGLFDYSFDITPPPTQPPRTTVTRDEPIDDSFDITPPPTQPPRTTLISDGLFDDSFDITPPPTQPRTTVTPPPTKPKTPPPTQPMTPSPREPSNLIRTSTLITDDLNGPLEDSFDVINLSDDRPRPDTIVQEPFKFQTIINYRGRTKRAREGAPGTKKKRKTSNLIDEVESIFPKKKPQAEVPVKKTRGPYKQRNLRIPLKEEHWNIRCA